MGMGLRAEPNLGAGNFDCAGPFTGPLGGVVPLQVVPSIWGERLEGLKPVKTASVFGGCMGVGSSAFGIGLEREGLV